MTIAKKMKKEGKPRFDIALFCIRESGESEQGRRLRAIVLQREGPLKGGLILEDRIWLIKWGEVGKKNRVYGGHPGRPRLNFLWLACEVHLLNHKKGGTPLERDIGQADLKYCVHE